ncbi:alanine--tRNA ligase-related protein [Nocardia sp. NPDC051756]|uniref:alanine--tRNA ligase-related protein n=1 Tax=Nocardia sp. NPDC051756 TaxID=3154751 RepID=UPI00343A584E
MITTDHTVQLFLDFFRERGHELTPGGSLIPSPGDPVLFTTSGMHPLTPYLMGRPHPLGRRLTGRRRCLRTTDLDEVGDETHLTVFEMLGSWSLGDYARVVAHVGRTRLAGRTDHGRELVVQRPDRALRTRFRDLRLDGRRNA